MTAEVVQIGDHYAKTCPCGSVRFILLASRKVECDGCGAQFPMFWFYESEMIDEYTAERNPDVR